MAFTTLPRVLVINGEPFNRLSSQGITLSRLFYGWPKDKIRQIYTTSFPPDTTVCASGWRLYHRDCYPRFLRRKRPAEDGLCVATRIPNGRHAGTGPIGPKLRQQLNAVLDLLRYQIEGDLVAWLDEFQPQVVYSCLSSLRITRLVEFAARRFHVPIVPHIMDDWWAAPYHGAWGAALIGPLLRQSFRKILCHVPLLLTIGEDMSQEFNRRFGLPCRNYMNCLEDKWIDTWGQNREAFDGVKIAIFGNLDYGRASLLKDFSDALNIVGEELKLRSVALNVYSYSNLQHIEQRDAGPGLISVRRPPEDDCLRDVFQEHSIMAHLENFTEANQNYYRYSISGKLPVYLASGRPILVYGPEDGGTARYLRRNGCGLIVGQKNPKKLALAIRTLVTNNHTRAKLISRAYAVLNDNFRQSVVTQSFQRTLAQVVKCDV